MTSHLNRSLSLLLLSAATWLGASGAALAQAPAPAGANATPGVDARQERQQARIADGVASGALTGREARRLQHQQARIAHAEAHAKADGVVTPAERRQLHQKQDHASQQIHRQKHDGQHRRHGGGAGSTDAPASAK